MVRRLRPSGPRSTSPRQAEATFPDKGGVKSSAKAMAIQHFDHRIGIFSACRAAPHPATFTFLANGTHSSAQAVSTATTIHASLIA